MKEVVHILSILVMHNCKIEESKTLHSWLQSYGKYPQIYNSFKLIIYDNSFTKQSISINLPFEYEYVHNPANVGVAKAYNYALNIAKNNNYDWLLLFDQDSSFPKNYISTLFNTCQNINPNEKIVACVPKVFHNNIFFSPSRVLWGGIHRPIDKNHKGICNFEIMAIGSGALIRKSFILSIQGFNETYWLDCLDRWLFNTIYSEGKKVYVINLIIKHNLSIFNFDKHVTEHRYLNQLKYETLFMQSYKTKSENYFFLLTEVHARKN